MPSMVGVIMRSMAWLSAILPKKSVSRGSRWRMRSGQQKRRAVGPTLINGSHNDPGICREYRDFQPGGKGEVSDLGMIYARRNQARFGHRRCRVHSLPRQPYGGFYTGAFAEG